MYFENVQITKDGSATLPRSKFGLVNPFVVTLSSFVSNLTIPFVTNN